MVAQAPAPRAGTPPAAALTAEAGPSGAPPTLQSSMEALNRGELVTAEQGFRKLSREAPRSAELHDLLGYTLMLQNKSTPALAELRQATVLAPTLGPAVAHLAEALAQSGDSKGALEQFRRAISLGNAEPETYIAYAHSLSAAGDNAQAEAQLQKALRLDGENGQQNGGDAPGENLLCFGCAGHSRVVSSGNPGKPERSPALPANNRA